MTKYFLLILSVFLIISVYAAPVGKNKPVFNKFVPPKIMTTFEEERPKVAPTGEFSSMPMPAGKKKSSGKSGSLAAKLSSANESFIWRPSKLSSSAIGTADLTGAALSPDGSLVVISERIGGEDKPNSTRLLFFNVHEGRLSGGFEIPELLLTDIRFTGKNDGEILAVRHKFDPFQAKDGIVKIDLKSRRIIDSFDSPKGAVTSFSITDEQLLFTIKNSSDIYFTALRDFSSGRKKMQTRISEPLVDSTSGIIAAFDKRNLELFRSRDGVFHPEYELIKVPENFTPYKSIIIDSKTPAICFIGPPEEPLWYFRGRTFRQLKERCGGFLSYDHNTGLLYAGLAANARIALFQMPEAAESSKPAAPNRLKPSNRNGTYALLSVPSLKKQQIQIDNRGNVFILDMRKKRWKKSVIHIADRAGFRK